MAARHRDQSLADLIAPVVRRYTMNVKHSLNPGLAFRLFVMASASIEDEAKAGAWLSHHAEFLGSRDMSKEDAQALYSDLAIVSRAVPTMRQFLKRALAATASVSGD